MSWLFSQALVEEYLGGISSGGEPSAPLNGSPIQQAYCAPDKTTAFSRLSRFGMTFKPLTEPLGGELLMSYLAAFRAKTSQQPEKAPELTESDQECGKRWRGSFVRFDRDSSSWRTAQCSLLEGFDEFLETWPQWGLMRHGECWEQPTWAPRINETGSGLSEKLPTPQASDYLTKRTSASWKAKGGVNFSLANPEIQAMWPTPTSSMMPCEGTVRIMRKQWLAGNCTLEEASAIAGRDVRKAQGKVPEHSTSGHKLPEPAGGKLNPTWVEWLMGWPLGWTDLKPLETDRFQQWRQLHSTPYCPTSKSTD